MTKHARGSLLAFGFLLIGLAGTALMFVVPVVSFFDWRTGDGYAVSRTEAILFAAMVTCLLIVRLGAPAVVRHGYRMKGETPPSPLPVRNAHWARTVFFCLLVAAAIWFS